MAAQSKYRKTNINLLFPQGIPDQGHVKILKWLVSYGRFFVIIVELVVIGIFMYRYTLDVALNNTKKQINQEIRTIDSLADVELQIRRTQFKLSTVNSHVASLPEWDPVMTALANITPEGVLLSNIAYEHNPTTPDLAFRLTGSALQNKDLALLLKAMRANEHFSNILITSLSQDQGSFLFIITGGIK